MKRININDMSNYIFGVSINTSKRLAISMLIIFSTTIAFSQGLGDQWTSGGNYDLYDSDENGVEARDYNFSATVRDGSGYYVAYVDENSGSKDIYVQYIDSYGSEQWVTGGLPAVSDASDQSIPAVTSNTNGDAIVAWSDERNGNMDIYVQMLNSSGGLQWTVDGVSISNASNDQKYVQIASDGSGGAIIAWVDERNGNSNDDIYVQRINSSGVVQWTSNGVSITSETSIQEHVRIVEDGNGGAILVWQDDRSGTESIYAQKINSSGVTQWGSGIEISDNSTQQLVPELISDGAGGAIITWQDNVNGNYDVFAQHLNSSGNAQWVSGGIAVVSDSKDQLNPVIAQEGNAGNIVIAWADNRGSRNHIYAQKLNSSGVAQWTSDGIQVVDNSLLFNNLDISKAGESGVFLAWQNFENVDKEIMFQYLDADGVSQYPDFGESISTVSNQQIYPVALSDDNTAIAFWKDRRVGDYHYFYDGFDMVAPLPVEMTSFEVEVVDGEVKLNWVTLTEVNNEKFIIERYSDGIDFEEIDEVEGSGNSNSKKVYNLTDAFPPEGVIYYRIKQVDYNGDFEYSDVIAVSNYENEEMCVLGVTPNPCIGNCNVSFEDCEGDYDEVKFQIYDSFGKPVYASVSKEVTSSNVSFDLNTNSFLTPGVYIIRAGDENNPMSKKVIIK